MPIIFIVFIVLPLIEIALLIKVGGIIGIGATIGWLILSAIVGGQLARRQGLKILWHIQDKLNQGELPAQQTIEAMLLLIASFCLIVPGYLTDTIGLLLLIPFLRVLVAQKMLQSSAFNQVVFTRFNKKPNHGNTFDGEFTQDHKPEHPDQIEKK